MFNNPFSFEGRIRRTEYGLSLIIVAVARVTLMMVIVGAAGNSSSADGLEGIFFLLSIPPMSMLKDQHSRVINKA